MTDKPSLSRRSILVGTALTGAAAAVGGAADAATDIAPVTDDKRTVVLKDTPHTRAYMALARKG
ncbi:hypothetical protein PARPLA_00419 [Rhodobacteraceae bacterium THAF1]|uniref:twin-arginine translocation pathway signal n=1 Tax=Palleronia sp. THAF1 TaxID=2587842 RepID=UPI000F41DBEC|nr:twin-arginine translocation pathway signal [Palleronia sp. THAF1]QFU10018.1 hypothetical protein FIU81_15165 [Palleronia sp. THAF1]VDC17077.1 hypothetical protein PARPLA_00419 [Rhodobacteraceae bacterium THAF1]